MSDGGNVIGFPHGFNGDGNSAPPPPRQPSYAAHLLAHAGSLVDGDRDRQHGNRRECHLKIAVIWDAWNKVKTLDGPDTDFDVAIKMGLLKLVRTQMGEYNADDIADALGYFSIAGELGAPK